MVINNIHIIIITRYHFFLLCVFNNIMIIIRIGNINISNLLDEAGRQFQEGLVQAAQEVEPRHNNSNNDAYTYI